VLVVRDPPLVVITYPGSVGLPAELERFRSRRGDVLDDGGGNDLLAVHLPPSRIISPKRARSRSRVVKSAGRERRARASSAMYASPSAPSRLQIRSCTPRRLVAR